MRLGKSTLLEALKRCFTGKGLRPEQIPPTIGLNIGTFTVGDPLVFLVAFPRKV